MGRPIESREGEPETKIRILALGGSLITQEDGSPNGGFLPHFRHLIEDKVREGEVFIIVCGGGQRAREDKDLALQVNPQATQERLDEIGIRDTWVNAAILQAIFGEQASPETINELTSEKVDFNLYKIFFAAGSTAGHSTDTVAIKIAQKLGVKEVLKLTNVDQIYTADPKTDPGARPLIKTTWEELKRLGIVPDKWKPGLHSPAEPGAYEAALIGGIRMVLVRGDNLPNFKNLLEGGPFVGTTIEPLSSKTPLSYFLATTFKKSLSKGLKGWSKES